MGLLPNTEWKLLFALSRWGGFRVGSEPRRLNWDDVSWQGTTEIPYPTILIHSKKTKRYKGKETRIIPIFPELLPLLQDRYEQAEEGEELVLPFLVGRTDASLRKTLERAIDRAGLTQWPILWHSMRKARQNELERDHPSHIVAYWMGNSVKTAEKHYLHPDTDDYAKAIVKITEQNDVKNDV